jgi:serine-type D-Ala-D-Ala carboxypeptidase (penicillin-binding protein 5/6)
MGRSPGAAPVKTIALLVALVLHLSGAWGHLPSGAKAVVDSGATTGTLHPIKAGDLDTMPLGPLPIRTGTTALQLDAAAAYAIDVDTGTVLYDKNGSAKRPIASITKLVTALVTLSRHDPSEQVAVPELPNYGPEDERLGFNPGEAFTIGQLVQAALVQSAADAADALAITDAGSIQKFAARMNLKMSEWGVPGVHFSNASGLQDQDNYASASALSKIAQLALTNPVIRQDVGYTQATIVSSAGRRFDMTNTDTLLSNSGFYGIKTGYTLAAGECFLGLTRIGGHEVITVVLGATDRFGASVSLVNWISHNWQWL